MATATPPAPRALATDPLRSFKFNVVIPVVQSGALNTTVGMARLGFMSMSGLGIAIEPLTYREGGDNLTTRKMPGQADFNPITLSRGLFSTDNDNWEWMSIIFTAMYGSSSNSMTAANPGTDFRTTVYINVLQHPNTASVTQTGPAYQGTYPQQDTIIQVSFKLYSAWIGSLAYSDMDAGGNAVAVEQMSLNYEGFDMQWGGTGYTPSGSANTW